MDQRRGVLFQAILTLAVVAIGIALCGHKAAVGLFWLLIVATALWLPFALVFHVQAWGKRDAQRRRNDWRALRNQVIGFAIPLGITIYGRSQADLDGVAFNSMAGPLTVSRRGGKPRRMLGQERREQHAALAQRGWPDERGHRWSVPQAVPSRGRERRSPPSRELSSSW